MEPFDLAAPTALREALDRARDGSAYLAGGTTLVDLMKLGVMTPDLVLDLNEIDETDETEDKTNEPDESPMRGVRLAPDSLRIGALERMSDVAADPAVTEHYPVLAEALLHSASPQLRNMATIGGNLLQRTRCGYFRDTASPCNKRAPGTGCPAVSGDNRTHAILGTSDACVATHASDLAVALVALDARVTLRGRGGARGLPLDDLYLLPGGTPHLEHRLRPGEVVTGVVVPRPAWARRSAYVKVRDRSSYEFALASAAVAVELRRGAVHDVRIAAGGVGTRPWRLPAVEDALRGRPLRQDAVEEAAAVAADGAKPLAHNGFKAALLRRTVTRALMSLVV